MALRYSSSSFTLGLYRHHPLTYLRRRGHVPVMLLLLAGDVQLNPGPRNWKFPCGIGEKPVKGNHKGIFDVCQIWLHTHCICMTDDEYSELQASPDSWSCKRLREALPFADCSLLSVSASQPSSNPAGALSIGMSN